MKTLRTIASFGARFEQFEGRTLMSAVPHLTADGPGQNSNDHPATTVPARASALSAAVAGMSVKLNWTDNSNNEAGFSIFRVNTSTHTLTLVGQVDANVTTFTDAKPVLGTDVYVVRAVDVAGHGEVSNAVTVKIAAPVVVVAPNKLRSAAVSSTSIILNWEGAKNATGGFQIQRSDGQGNWLQVGQTGPTGSSFTDTGLTAATRYSYRIIADGADGHTATSSLLVGQTKASDKGEIHAPTHK